MLISGWFCISNLFPMCCTRNMLRNTQIKNHLTLLYNRFFDCWARARTLGSYQRCTLNRAIWRNSGVSGSVDGRHLNIVCSKERIVETILINWGGKPTSSFVVYLGAIESSTIRKISTLYVFAVCRLIWVLLTVLFCRLYKYFINQIWNDV